MFDIIPIEAIVNKTWLDPCFRDYGHHLRMVRLVERLQVLDFM
jgi:hypothetical protein